MTQTGVVRLYLMCWLL